MVYKKDYNQIDENTTDQAQSRLNAAGLINSALENLWTNCYNAMAKGDFVIWNRKLDAIWIILGGDCKRGDPDDKLMDSINMSIYKTGKLHHKILGFNKLQETESENIALQYLLLKDKSLFLRRLQNKQGKGTAYVNYDDSDFD